jgi:hypothetical protein
VARNLAVDRSRDAARVRVGDVPVRYHQHDVADEVVAREALSLFRSDVALLPPAEMAAILSVVSTHDERRIPGRVTVARMRARRKLRHVLDALPVVVGTAQLRLRRAPIARGALSVAAVVVAATTAVSVVRSTPHRSDSVGSTDGGLAARAGAAARKRAGEAEHVELRTPTHALVGLRGSAQSAPGSGSKYPLPTPPTVGVGAPGDSRPIVSGGPGRDDQEGIAMCTGTIATPYACYYYPKAPGVPQLPPN